MSLIASPVPGTFTAPQLVTLTDAGSDAIYYTRDGSAPQYAGYARDWNDGLLANQTNTTSNGTGTFTNPGTFLRQTLTAAGTSSSSFLDLSPIPGFQVTQSRISVRIRFNSGSCTGDTNACLLYRCAGKFTANDTFGYAAGIKPRGGAFLGRGSNTSTGSYTPIADAGIPGDLAYDTWHTLTVTLAGSTHTVSVNGIVRGIWWDSTYQVPGFVGIRTYSGAASTPAVDYDDFRVEYVSGTAYTAPVPVVPATSATTIRALSVTGTVASSVTDFVYTPKKLRAPQPTWSVTNRTVTLSNTSSPTGLTGTYTDASDGLVYKTVLLPDGKWWFAENFRRATGMTTVPNGNAGNVAVYGGLYTQDAALAQVPAGCHLPTLGEVTALVTACGGNNASTASALREASALWPTPGTNATGFSARPSGFYWADHSQYGGFGDALTMMTSTGNPGNFTMGLFKLYSNDTLYTGSTHGNDAGSVRYVVDSGNVPDALDIYYTVDGTEPNVSTAQTGTYTDARDGKVYKTVLMPDGKWWSSENLAYNHATSYAPNNDIATIPTYGRLYTYASALASVPTGTHVPTLAEIDTLRSVCGSPAGLNLMSVGAISGITTTNLFGFSGLAGGFRNWWTLLPEHFNSGMYLWTATADGAGAGNAKAVTIDSVNPELGTWNGNTGYGFSVRFVVDSGNVPDPTPANLYTAPFPYKIGQVVKTVVRATGFLDSLPATLYPFDTTTGYRSEPGYVVTAESGWLPQVRPAWMAPKLESTTGQAQMTSWLNVPTYKFTGTILGTPEPPTTGTASTRQQRFQPDEGIQISVFPRQPHAFDNRVDWGNGPVTNRSLKVFWRIPQNDSYLLASVKTDVKKTMTFGDLNIDSQSDTWAIGGAQAQAQLSAPALAHYIDVNANLGFVTGSAQSAPVRVTGGRNSPPMAIWLSPGAGNVRLNIPFQCNINVTDPDLDNVNYVITADGTPIKAGTVPNGTVVSFSYTPVATGSLALSITLTDQFNFQTTVPAPNLTVLDNDFPLVSFVSPANNTAVFHDTYTNVSFDISDKETELMTWTLLNNNVTISSGTASTATTVLYRFKVPTGQNNISLVVADPLGAAPALAGPTVWGSLCQITDLTLTGKTEVGSPITLTPTTDGPVSSVSYSITTSTGVVNLSSAVAPFSVVWTPTAVTLPDTAQIVATAIDAAGHGPAFTKSVSITGSTIEGDIAAIEDTQDIVSIAGIGANEAISVVITRAPPQAATAGDLVTIDAQATDSVESITSLYLQYKLPGTTTWVDVPMNITGI